MANLWSNCSQRKWPRTLAAVGLCTVLTGGMGAVVAEGKMAIAQAATPIQQNPSDQALERKAEPIVIAQQFTRTSETVTGQIDVGPQGFDGDNPIQIHPFEGKAGESIRIDLISEDFDTLLILLGPDGRLIAQNDDIDDGNTNSRLAVVLPADGIYQIFVTAYTFGQSGEYTLTWTMATASDITQSQALQSEDPNQQLLDLFEQIGDLYQGRGDPQAISALEENLEILRAELGENDPATFFIQKTLADLYIRQNRHTEAELLLQEMLEAFKQDPEGAYSSFSEFNFSFVEQIGYFYSPIYSILDSLLAVYLFQGRYREAELLFKDNLEFFQGSIGENNPYFALTLSGLALLYQAQGRYVEVEPLHLQALAIIQGKVNESRNEAFILNNLASFYRTQGRYREAESTHLKALEVAQDDLTGNRFIVAQILNGLALNYYVWGLYEEAEDYNLQYLEYAQDLLGERHPFVALGFNNLASVYQWQGRDREAESLLLQALDIYQESFGEQHPNVAVIKNNLGEIYIDQDRYDEARDLQLQALGIVQNQFGIIHPDVVNIFFNLAVLSWAEEQYLSVLDFLGQGLDSEESVLTQNLVGGSDVDKRNYLTTVTGTTNITVSFHLSDLSISMEAGQLALTTVLQRKGRILDLFTNLRAQLADDPTAVALLNDLNGTNTQLANVAGAPLIDQAQLRALQDRINDLEDQLSRRSSEFAELTASPSLEAIQATLPDQTALVEFIRYQPFEPQASRTERFGPSHYAAYILTPDGTIQGIDLGPAARIDSAVTTLAKSLASADTPPNEIKENAQALDKLVMAPVRAALGDTKTVFISPDGNLNLIPFEALVDESGRYLVETYQFRYLTSGRDLMRLENTVASTNPAVLVGYPTYGRRGEPVAQSDTRTIDLKNHIFPALEGTQAEIDLITSLLPRAEPYSGTNATEAMLKAQQRPSILHIATHGFFEPVEEAINPLLQSGLILAGAAIGKSGPGQNGIVAFENGILTALEVTGLNLRGTQLVVLSACETGRGELTVGEGVYGLRRALVLAGSQSQVISLWKVADTATQEWMVQYYQHLLAGAPRDQALRDTQLAFLEHPDYSHPYYWAAFIGSGDWRPLQLEQ